MDEELKPQLEPTKKIEPKSNPDLAIQIVNMKKKYNNGYTALNDVSFSVERGDIVGYLGPNGAGKTTTIKTLANLLQPTDGQALINGINVNRNPKAALDSVGFLIEVPGIYEYLTPHEVMTYFGRVHGMKKSEIAPRIKEVLELVQIEDWEHKALGSFSTGMQRRFGIANAILHTPDILILDEPVIGLDPKGIKHVRDMLKQFQKEGITIFLSSHLLSEVAETCDKVIFLDKGVVVEQGTVSDIVNKTKSNSIDLQLLEMPTDAIISRIGALSQVDGVSRSSEGLKVAFDGTPESASSILADIISTGTKVVSFSPVSASLEEFYISIMGDEKGVS